MLLLMNSKKDSAKKDLRLSYSQGNKSAYPVSAEAMEKYLSTQYTIKISINPRNKRGIRTQRRVTIPNLKTAILPLWALLVHTLKKL